MPVYIRHIETLVPPHTYTQDYACEQMKAWMTNDKDRRLVHRVYRNSGIETRHSVLGDFHPDPVAPLFAMGPDGRPMEPGTRERNDRFAVESRRLSVEAVRRALACCPEFAPADVTHVVTATCTGFANPGPDYHIVRDVGLSPAAQRYALGFMGCYAALPALRMATQFCQADPSAVVVVVAVELCTLHLHFGDGPDFLLANAIFADGAAAAVVSARQPPSGTAAYAIDGFGSALIPSGERDMAWRIGNQGFEITLSTYVPDVIGANVRGLVESELRGQGLGVGDIRWWAIHPGGKAILDKVQAELALDPVQVAPSRDVLRRNGNMSSVTGLFVLADLLRRGPQPAERVCAMGFGPGLTLETAWLHIAG